MGEQWVRPPVVAAEAPSAAAARWRFRVVAVLLLGLVAALVVALFVQFSGVTSEDPGFTGGLPLPSAAVLSR